MLRRKTASLLPSNDIQNKGHQTNRAGASGLIILVILSIIGSLDNVFWPDLHWIFRIKGKGKSFRNHMFPLSRWFYSHSRHTKVQKYRHYQILYNTVLQKITCLLWSFAYLFIHVMKKIKLSLDNMAHLGKVVSFFAKYPTHITKIKRSSNSYQRWFRHYI